VNKVKAYKVNLVCLSARFNSRAAGRIFVVSDIDVVPVHVTQNSYFLSFTINNRNMEETVVAR
jgi:hypothetical protein